MSLRHELLLLCKHNRDGSFATQRERRKILVLCSTQLEKLGYKKLRSSSLKPKHVNALVQVWKTGDAQMGVKPLYDATIKNRIVYIRWWSEKVNKANVVPAPTVNSELVKGFAQRYRKPRYWRTII